MLHAMSSVQLGSNCCMGIIFVGDNFAGENVRHLRKFQSSNYPIVSQCAVQSQKWLQIKLPVKAELFHTV